MSDLAKLTNDPATVTEAIRRLVEIIVAEDVALIDRLGYWPDEVQRSNAGAALIHPVSYACHRGVSCLVAHLGTLIGIEAARAQLDAFFAEHRGTLEGRDTLAKVEASSGKPHPSTPSAIH